MSNQVQQSSKDSGLSGHVKISLGGETRVVKRSEASDVMDELHAKYGGVPSVEDYWFNDEEPRGTSEGSVVGIADRIAEKLAAKQNSDWTNQVVDEEAKTRIEGAHDELRKAGIDVDTSQQLYGTGTRMANEGYETQHERKAEHDQLLPFAQAAEALAALVEAEGREDHETTARELAEHIKVNGNKLVAFDRQLSENAIRGLMSLLPKAKAMGYSLALLERAEGEFTPPKGEALIGRADLLQLAHVLKYECTRWGDRTLKLRTRKAPYDIFAIVTPSYAPADAPEVVKQIVPEISKDVKGTYLYHAGSTQWELRAEVFTPTPVDEQAVGEPFKGYATFQARDNGTSRFRGGGGVELLRCLNASVYCVKSKATSRVHRGNVMFDIAKMATAAQAAIHALCRAWGLNRVIDIPLPTVEGEKLTIQQAIPGFYRYLLTSRYSEVRALLPGNSERNVDKLTAAYFNQRREGERIIRSDFAQGMTWAIKDLEADERRDAEIRIGNWLTKPTSKVQCELREVEAEES